MSTPRRVSLGFEGGQVLALRVERQGDRGSCEKALSNGGWHDLESDDGTVRVNLDKLVYISAEIGEPRVGFG